jgi:L-ribulose-5-phosphate 3-epimerase UlaE
MCYIIYILYTLYILYICKIIVEGTMIHDCMCIVGHRRPPLPSQTTTVVGGKGLIIQVGENRVFQAG